MADPTAQRFKNIDDLKYATDDFITLKQVEVTEDTSFLEDSGDTDTQPTFVEKGMTSCSFTLMIADPIQAEAIKAHAKGDITFKGQPATGGVACLVTITGAVCGGRSQQAMHNGVWVTRISGRATGFSVATTGS